MMAVLAVLVMLALTALAIWLLGGSDAGSPVGQPAVTTSAVVDSYAGSATTAPATAGTGYREVQGPQGLSLAIPDGWQPKNGPVSGNFQADDPNDPDVFLRFGGTTRPGNDLMTYLLGGERGNPNIQDGYNRLQLSVVSYLGAIEAADWEFTFFKGSQERHAFGRYWYDNGIMYVIYGSAPIEKWSQIQPILEHAIDSASVR